MESGKSTTTISSRMIVSIPFKRESSWKVENWTIEGNEIGNVSIPFKRESSWKEHVFSSQSPQDSAHLKTVRDHHRAFFTHTLTPKLLQTFMDTDSRAILRPEWRIPLSTSMLFDNFR